MPIPIDMTIQSMPALPVDHIGISVRDLVSGIKFYSESFGLRVTHQEVLQKESIEVAFLENGASQIELITTSNAESALGQSLSGRGPGLHHICFRTLDIRAELRRLEALGHQLIDKEPRIGAKGKLIAFIHPKSSEGVLIELCQIV